MQEYFIQNVLDNVLPIVVLFVINRENDALDNIRVAPNATRAQHANVQNCGGFCHPELVANNRAGDMRAWKPVSCTAKTLNTYFKQQ